MSKVLVALSGGVDSAVAALLLKRAGTVFQLGKLWESLRELWFFCWNAGTQFFTAKKLKESKVLFVLAGTGILAFNFL